MQQYEFNLIKLEKKWKKNEYNPPQPSRRPQIVQAVTKVTTVSLKPSREACEIHIVVPIGRRDLAHMKVIEKWILTSASMYSFQNLPELGNWATSLSYVFLALSIGWF